MPGGGRRTFLINHHGVFFCHHGEAVANSAYSDPARVQCTHRLPRDNLRDREQPPLQKSISRHRE